MLLINGCYANQFSHHTTHPTIESNNLYVHSSESVLDSNSLETLLRMNMSVKVSPKVILVS